MTRLAALQREFQAYLLGRASDMPAQVLATPKADAALLLGVYRDAYVLRLLEALTADYPALARLAGRARFAGLARAYVAAHPSRHPSIRWLGRHLAGFLRETPPWAAEPVLAEVAAFEWALGEAFDAADASPAIFEAVIAGLPPGRLPSARFATLPSFRRLELAWNAPAIWRAMEAGAAALPPPERGDAPLTWVIWRPRLTTEFRSLAEDEAHALDILRAGGDFAALCEGLLRWHDGPAAAGRAAGLLRLWIDQGMIAGTVT